MKTINASKPAANPQQFTRVSSNPLLISAQKQMLKVEEIKKAKEQVKVYFRLFFFEVFWYVKGRKLVFGLIRHH